MIYFKNIQGAKLKLNSLILFPRYFFLLFIPEYIYIEGDPGGMCETSRECSLC